MVIVNIPESIFYVNFGTFKLRLIKVKATLSSNFSCILYSILINEGVKTVNLAALFITVAEEFATELYGNNS